MTQTRIHLLLRTGANIQCTQHLPASPAMREDYCTFTAVQACIQEISESTLSTEVLLSELAPPPPPSAPIGRTRQVRDMESQQSRPAPGLVYTTIVPSVHISQSCLMLQDSLHVPGSTCCICWSQARQCSGWRTRLTCHCNR